MFRFVLVYIRGGICRVAEVTKGVRAYGDLDRSITDGANETCLARGGGVFSDRPLDLFVAVAVVERAEPCSTRIEDGGMGARA